MRRALLMRVIQRELGNRSLVWFGTRGHDAEAIGDVDNFDGSFSLIAGLDHRMGVQSLSLEELSGQRMDLDLYDLDDDLSEPVEELKRALMRAVARPSVLFTYRPTAFLSRISFVRRARCQYLGMFWGHQAAFEYKPWIETELGALPAVSRVEWRYIDNQENDPAALVSDGPVMLRRSRTTGGVGLVRVDNADQLRASWPHDAEGFVSVSPFIDGATPMNVGAVVWRDGVTTHPASVQLLGIPGATTRPFGYCGNDFDAVANLDPIVLDRIETMTLTIGDRLGQLGYLGAFGIDFLVRDLEVLFTEVNPRFQGSTHASCRISVERDEACLLLEHLAAFMGLPAPERIPLREHVRRGSALSHVVIHHTGADPARINPAEVVEAWRRTPGFVAVDVATRPEIVTQPGGTIARLTLRGGVLGDGRGLAEPWDSLLASPVGTRR